MSKLKRILIVLGIVALIGGTYLWLFGVQTAVTLIVHYKFREIPYVANTPVALPDLSVSEVPHAKISSGGYEVELPWDDIDDQKSKRAGPIRITAFHSGNAFWFSTFGPKEFVNELMKTEKLDPQTFRQTFGDEAFQSDYGFMSKMLQVTPGEFTPFISRRQATVGQFLLLIKAISMPKADSGIFSIRTPDFQGFQFENAQSRPYRISDELYSNDGGIDVVFFQKVGGSTPSISQPEINRIIQTIHKIPAHSVVPHGGMNK